MPGPSKIVDLDCADDISSTVTVKLDDCENVFHLYNRQTEISGLEQLGQPVPAHFVGEETHKQITDKLSKAKREKKDVNLHVVGTDIIGVEPVEK